MSIRFNLENSSGDYNMCCASGRPLDSPDSGLPPSPSVWLQPDGPERAGASPRAEEGSGAVPLVISPQFRPQTFEEGIELEPLPPSEIRYTSSIHYDSDRRFIHCLSLQPRGFSVDSCSQTMVTVSQSTWRHFRTQLYLEPRQQVQGYHCTTIVYPKHARMLYTTHLHYNCRRHATRFLSSVELETELR
ncbi:hypothetical protein GJAV_G00061450 [Gymnothorax javanicus]|nr:hypothetical protein GJAV_G00061450 [Gymnothorax javanicus]